MVSRPDQALRRGSSRASLDRVASPPTERAVAIVELLAGTSEPMTVSRIAELLGITRSTCTAILDTLERLHWVERGADLAYQPGPGLIPLANAIRARLPVVQRSEPVLRELAGTAGVEAATLDRVDADHITLVAKVNRRPGFDAPPSFRLPIIPPFGVAVAAFWPEVERDRWIAQAEPARARTHLRRILATVESTGISARRLDRAGQLLQEALAVSAAAAPTSGLHRGAASGDHRIAALAAPLATSGFTVADLRPAKQPFALSYVGSTVFDELDRPCYCVEAHVLRHDVTHDELLVIVAAVRRAAAAITTMCGGDPDRRAWTGLGLPAR